MKMTSTECPECGGLVGLDEDVELNEILVCGDCGVDLEVMNLNPPVLQLAPMEEEDWGE
jgi:alpha-aminoadipate carrier protein LysW